MMLIQLLNIKNKGFKYIFINILIIFTFSVLYKIFDRLDDEKEDDSYLFWLYFSSITQTTVGYAGIDLELSNDKYLSAKSLPLKFTILLQLFTIIFINGYFMYI